VLKEEDRREENLKKTGKKRFKKDWREEESRKKITFFDRLLFYKIKSTVAFFTQNREQQVVPYLDLL